MIGGLLSSSTLGLGCGVWLPVPAGVAFGSASGAYIPKRVEDVKFKTERVRDKKVSEEGSAGVDGEEVEGVEDVVSVKEGRRGTGWTT